MTPVQVEVYGFIRSPVEERGSRRRKTSRSSHVGTTFSMPTTETSTSGRVRHIRPLPSDSTTTSVPVSATAKLAPETAIRAVQELLAQVHPRGAGQHRGFVGQALGRLPGHPASEDLPDLGPVAVDRRHQDVAGQVVAELHDQLGQVGLPGGDALAPRGPR